MTNEEAVRLQMEYDAMRVCRAEDHRTCEALRRSLADTQDKLRAEVDRSTFLRTRLDAANADVQRLSAMVEELRDRLEHAQSETPRRVRPMPMPLQVEGKLITSEEQRTNLTYPDSLSRYCESCGVAWSAHRDDECEKRRAQDANRAATVKP